MILSRCGLLCCGLPTLPQLTPQSTFSADKSLPLSKTCLLCSPDIPLPAMGALFHLTPLLCSPTSPACRDSSVGSGAYSDYANATGALQIWPGHRYYASNSPYTPVDNLTHFTIEQALVDHIELVLFVQSTLNMTRNPVIALGSSYSESCPAVMHLLHFCAPSAQSLPGSTATAASCSIVYQMQATSLCGVACNSKQ